MNRRMLRKCSLCGKKTTTREVFIDGHPPERLSVCSDSCEQSLREFVSHYRATRWYLLSGMLMITLAAAVFALMGAAHLLPLCLTSFGLLIILFPFATGETIELMGVRKSVVLVRVIGLLTSFSSAILFMSLA